ncbi:hypothetical protein FGB62_47g135 [Gracilaria domingensis]|nr:hypothetical protein FGB62_47g135 [Gracilaria domingensis]
MPPPAFIPSVFQSAPARHGAKLCTQTALVPTPLSCSGSRSRCPPLCMSTSRQNNDSSKPDRRTILQLATLTALSALPLSDFAFAEEQAFETYNGPISLGFSFAYPSNWSVKKKPIKTHLSEVIVTSDKDAATTAGLVVDSVKISSIESFGTPQQVGEKVVAVETKKESVTDAAIQSTSAENKNGLTYYTLDYIVDSSRGVKRYIAKVTVTGGQLYVLTTQAKVSNFDEQTSETFAKMLDSFTVIKQYT